MNSTQWAFELLIDFDQTEFSWHRAQRDSFSSRGRICRSAGAVPRGENGHLALSIPMVGIVVVQELSVKIFANSLFYKPPQYASKAHEAYCKATTDKTPASFPKADAEPANGSKPAGLRESVNGFLNPAQRLRKELLQRLSSVRGAQSSGSTQGASAQKPGRPVPPQDASARTAADGHAKPNGAAPRPGISPPSPRPSYAAAQASAPSKPASAVVSPLKLASLERQGGLQKHRAFVEAGLKAAADGKGGWGQLFGIDAKSLLAGSSKDFADPKFCRDKATQIADVQKHLSKELKTLQFVTHPDRNGGEAANATDTFKRVEMAHKLATSVLEKFTATLQPALRRAS